MGVISTQTCPHCHTKNVAFLAAYNWRTAKGLKRALMICAACKEGIIRAYMNTSSIDDIVKISGSAESHGVELLQQWPPEQATNIPPDTPDNVANYYKQASDSLLSGNYDASGMMFRKALDAATKALAPERAKIHLIGRIEALVDDGRLTSDLGVWAHEIRMAGNDASHDEEPFKKEDAEALLAFTENFLRYSFTLPAAVAARKISRELDGNTART